MKVTVIRGFAAMMLAGALAGCVQPAAEDGIRILKSDADGVTLRGLIDATRTTPPEGYNQVATAQCARAGKVARFDRMEQRSTFGFDVIYACVAQA